MPLVDIKMMMMHGCATLGTATIDTWVLGDWDEQDKYPSIHVT